MKQTTRTRAELQAQGYVTIHEDASLGAGENAILPLKGRLSFGDDLKVVTEDNIHYWMLKRA